jgi:tetratricopeptide (TPR) repeat protein
MSPDIQLQIAISFHQQGNIDAAKSLYKEVVKSDPNNDTALTNLGLLEFNEGNFSIAFPLFVKLIDLDANNLMAIANAGICKASLGNPVESLVFFDDFLTKDSKNVQILTHRAAALSKIGKFSEALDSFNTAINLDPQNTIHYTNAGILCNENGDSSQAIEYLIIAIERDSANIQARSQLAIALMEKANYQDALNQCEIILSSHPNHVEAILNKGLIFYKLGQLNSAKQSFEALLKINPKSAIALVNLTLITISEAIESKSFQKAIDLSSKASSTIKEFLYKSNSNKDLTQFVPAYRIKHDLQQAHFLFENGDRNNSIIKLLEQNKELSKTTTYINQQMVCRLEDECLSAYFNYQLYDNFYQPPILSSCLNPEINWMDIEEKYFSSEHEAIYIDDFLNSEALEAFYLYSLFAKVWNKEYKSCYLGAFGNQGFISPLHLQLGVELKKAMPNIFKDYPLTQMWGFKYDTQLGKGINVHADFAKINLNFWITPDDSNLGPSSGGLKVYKFPAPSSWTFKDYNASAENIYSFLEENSLDFIKIPYRCNRAVLFNSALFHETDQINFKEGYTNRRINMTYLFGSQLA